MDRPADPLADVHRAQRHDFRRPRNHRRLEHLPVVAGRSRPAVLVGPADRRRALLLLGLPAPRQPRPGRARQRPGLPRGVRRRRRDRGAGRLRRPGRRRPRPVPVELRARHRPYPAGDAGQPRRPRAAAGAAADAARRPVAIPAEAVIGSSLPWLLAPAFHHVEAMNERLCESPRGWIAAPGEWLRQQLDLEHWAAFGHSFDALGALVTQLGTGPDAPATISVLSGDVHHSYVSRAHLGAHVASAVHQLTCSPVHNDMPRLLRVAPRLGWSRAAATAARGLAALADSPAPAIRWELTAGPYFGNAVSTLVHDRRTAHVTIERSDKQSQLQPLTTVQLRT